MKIAKKIEVLYEELTELETALNPPVPDPNLWPPHGWQIHPLNKTLLVQVVSESTLREMLFGSEAKTEFLKNAKIRVEQIKNELIPLFFKQPKEEGVDRVTKHGFVVMLKTELVRKIDIDALEETLLECAKVALIQEGITLDVDSKIIRRTPELKLTEYRNLPQSVRLQFDNALTVTPKQPKFEIFKQPE